MTFCSEVQGHTIHLSLHNAR